ncbi:MAG: hypothetical protein GX359_01380 [Clostridiales bacterium]|nr:hypothetical protein [Clostridiales bacterium]
MQWWVTVLLLGIIFMPLSSLLFSGFRDKGYLFSKTIGIAVTGYIMWLLSSLRVLKFTTTSCILSVFIAFIINILVHYLRKRKQGIKKQIISYNWDWKNVAEEILKQELLFFTLFLLFIYIRGFKPEAYGTEKFMDYGFMTSMMRSEYMPPQDFWFAGTNLNYYYVGQFMATFLTKLSFVQVSHGYNLMLMMVGAFAFVLPFSIVYNVIWQYIGEYTNEIDGRKRNSHLPIIGGLISGAGVCIAGNMHYPVYRLLEPVIRKFFGMEESTRNYWFPDATRFIGYHPETNDKTIHEFPAYSFVLGDLHAHVINIIFVLTVIGILLGWMNQRRAAKGQNWSIAQEVFHPSMIMVGFFIGLFHMTNFWDFPIYYVVSGAVILFSNMVVYNFKGKAFWLTAIEGIFIMGFFWLVSLPFTLKFDQISTNIQLVETRTPLNQLIILWGLPFFVVISFLCFLIADERRTNKENDTVQKEQKKMPLFQFMENLNSADLFILVLGLCAIGLVLIPEVIYVEDIYSGDYKRANTMFKLTYQAFIMFGISFGYLFIRFLRFGKTVRQKKTAMVGLILFLSSLLYSGNAVNAWFGNILDRERYQGIDASKFMEEEMPDDYLATNWMNRNISGTPVILEANGDSYTDYQRVSVITGLPTVLGWHTHEWLWKGDPSILDIRAEDISLIYTSSEESAVRALLNKYQIEYIYVGKLEQEKYEIINHELIKSLGKTVFRSPADDEKDYETYIVRIHN